MDLNINGILNQMAQLTKPREISNNWGIGSVKIPENLPTADPKAVADWQKAGTAAQNSAVNLGSVLGNSVQAQPKTNVLSNAFGNIWGKIGGFFR